MRPTGGKQDTPGDDRKVIAGIEYKKGDKVSLILNKHRSDAADMFLKGKTATIETIYTDYNDKVFLAVTVDDDPGQDLARELGRYMFFSPDEVQLIQSNQKTVK